ncbi:MAG: EamA family transporter [bacterium]|nr:EamA family transporter [bacterium]
MSWIYLVLVAQIINAGVFLTDKYLVGPHAKIRPLAYTFYVGIMSAVVVWTLPFGVVGWPTPMILLLSLATGVTYVASLLLLYRALQMAEVSDVAPVMGAVSALSTLFFSGIILREHLTENFMFGFALLVLGTGLMSYFRFKKHSLLNVLGAGALFGLSSVLIKLIFSQTEFWNGFFWSRMANVLIVLCFLLWPAWYKAIRGNFKNSPHHTKVLVVGNKVFAGLAFLLILAAINLGEVAVVNALGGLQFVILIIAALIFHRQFPLYFSESVHLKNALLQKVVATALIVFGYFILFL